MSDSIAPSWRSVCYRKCVGNVEDGAFQTSPTYSHQCGTSVVLVPAKHCQFRCWRSLAAHDWLAERVPGRQGKAELPVLARQLPDIFGLLDRWGANAEMRGVSFERQQHCLGQTGVGATARQPQVDTDPYTCEC